MPSSRGVKFAASWIRLAMITLCSLIALSATRRPAIAAPGLDELLGDLGFSRDDLQRIRNGELVPSTAAPVSNRETATATAFQVNAPMTMLIGMLEADHGFHNDPQIQAATEIGGSGSIDDFKVVVLQPGGDSEAQRYLSATPGDTLNLSTAEIAAFEALNGVAGGGVAKAESLVRRTLFARYQAYRGQGLAGIAAYARAADRQSRPADDLRHATEAAKGLSAYVPAFHDLLTNYPQGKPSGFTERFFCIRYAVDGRPNFVLRHRLIMPAGEAYVVVDRDFYVSHGYNTTQSVAALLPADGGAMVVYASRATTDRAGGFAESEKQTLARDVLAKQIEEIFAKTRPVHANQ